MKEDHMRGIREKRGGKGNKVDRGLRRNGVN